jgi:hydroxypyruvate isomerase
VVNITSSASDSVARFRTCAVTCSGVPTIRLPDHIDDIGHIQIADVPGRHEPGSGEIDWEVFFAALDALEYEGNVGLEYIPTESTASSFSLLKSLGFLH